MAEEPRPGMIVGGRYELIEVAGRGGMADVWRGRVRGDSGFVRDVAVKQMHPNLAIQPQYVAMFVEEARVGSVELKLLMSAAEPGALAQLRSAMREPSCDQERSSSPAMCASDG